MQGGSMGEFPIDLLSNPMRWWWHNWLGLRPRNHVIQLMRPQVRLWIGTALHQMCR